MFEFMKPKDTIITDKSTLKSIDLLCMFSFRVEGMYGVLGTPLKPLGFS
jgi:hypothetical protein